jgi:hypothetical protein
MTVPEGRRRLPYGALKQAAKIVPQAITQHRLRDESKARDDSIVTAPPAEETRGHAFREEAEQHNHLLKGERKRG